MDTSFQHYINGLWTAPDSTRHVDLFNPATETFRCRCPLGSDHDVDLAVTAARDAFENGWHKSDLSQRIAILENLLAEIDSRRDHFANAISREIGAPINFSRTHQVEAALGHLEATLAAAKIPENRNDIPVAQDMTGHRVRFEPMGVAALITPWNWPLNQIALKVGAALLSGCTMVLKPSELASETGILFAQCMAAAGIPNGVFNLILGDAETGRGLTNHADIDVISFTGSTRAGKSVALAAAKQFKPTTLELGGKSPNLLFEDCNLPLAVQQGVAHCFRNSGQSCNAASRMLVQAGIYKEVLDLAAQFSSTYKNGAADQAGSHMGPLVNKDQFDRVQSLIQKGIDEGATLLTGGLGRPDGFKKGFYIKPTVFVDVTPDMSIAREEIFGPVLTISKFSNIDDGIRQANDCAYGLAAYVQTANEKTADEASCRLKAGMIQVNGTSRAAGAPFGGVKASGHGREAGIWGIRAFQEIKSISGVRHRL
ncbi:MAG: aldehyde dehydrogenase family protein [Hyphomicrobiales bacterium]